MIKAHDLVGRALAQHSVDTGFFIMGGPTNGAISSCITNGLRMIDVRHEQAAAFMAQAYARLRGRPGLCMAASGPGTINLTTGLANALIDCAPVLAIGGSSPISQQGMGAFQEIDQLALMKPITKWSARVHDPRRIPEFIGLALRQAMSGKPGPVYLDLPGDVLYADVDEEAVRWPTVTPAAAEARPAASSAAIAQLTAMLQQAERPLILSGSGIIWSGASAEMERFVDLAGIPFYTTPQGRGVVPDDHALSFPRARSTAMREADLVLILGTRTNYVFGHMRAPRFAKTARFVRIDIEPAEIAGDGNLALGVVGDAKTVLAQICAALEGSGVSERFAGWRARLAKSDEEKREAAEAKLSTDAMPIHPLRLCKEVRDFIDRDAILVVDGQEILNYGRQSIPTFVPGHRLNSGPFGTMGVGLPFGVGAKAAMPDKQVVVLHGDGSFGLNAMELDTAVRHNLPLLVVISLNGGWTADPEKVKPGRDLGYTRFDRMAESLGCHGEHVERPEDIGPALQRAKQAVAEGRVAVVNVVTDWRARAQTAEFTAFTT